MGSFFSLKVFGRVLLLHAKVYGMKKFGIVAVKSYRTLNLLTYKKFSFRGPFLDATASRNGPPTLLLSSENITLELKILRFNSTSKLKLKRQKTEVKKVRNFLVQK